MKIFSRLENEKGATAVEAILAATLFLVVITAAYNLLGTGQTLYTVASDGFEAQHQGQIVLYRLTKYMRQAEKLNVPGYPIIYADDNGTFFDVKLDVDKDNKVEIVRFTINTDDYTVDMLMDYLDSNNKYNYEAAGQAYDAFYQVPSSAGDWDNIKVLAEKVVNDAGETGWPAQKVSTDPEKEKRLFTFYSDDFDAPLDSADPLWMNNIRGLKIYALTDVKPAQIPSPFSVTTNVNLRNISRE